MSLQPYLIFFDGIRLFAEINLSHSNGYLQILGLILTVIPNTQISTYRILHRLYACIHF